MRANFCILDFKKKVFLCLCLVVFFILLLDIGLYYIVNKKLPNHIFLIIKYQKCATFS